MKNLTTFGAIALCALSGFALYEWTRPGAVDSPTTKATGSAIEEKVRPVAVRATSKPAPSVSLAEADASSVVPASQKLSLPEALNSFETLMDQRQTDFSVRELKLMDEMLQNLRTAHASQPAR